MSNKYYIPKTNKKETAEEFKRVNERILEKFRSKGLTIDHYEMGNGYFIFNYGENAVMHFKLKEAPQWKFGVWLTKFKERKIRGKKSSGDYINIQIFAQNELWIDKFKPTRSYFCEELNVYWGRTYDEKNEVYIANEVLTDEKIDDELWDYQLIDPFALLWNENNLAFYLHMEEESFDRKHITRKEANKYMKDFLKKEKRENAFKNKAVKATTKKILKYAKKNKIKDIRIIDRNANDSGWIVSPAFDVVVTLDPIQFVLKSEKFNKELGDTIRKTDNVWRNKGKKKKEAIYYYSEFSNWPLFIVDGDNKRYYIEEDLGDGSLDETNSYDISNLTLEKARGIIKDYEDQLEKERQERRERNKKKKLEQAD